MTVVSPGREAAPALVLRIGSETSVDAVVVEESAPGHVEEVRRVVGEDPVDLRGQRPAEGAQARLQVHNLYPTVEAGERCGRRQGHHLARGC